MFIQSVCSGHWKSQETSNLCLGDDSLMVIQTITSSDEQSLTSDRTVYDSRG